MQPESDVRDADALTLRELLRSIEQRLAGAGIEEAQVEAGFLLGHAAGASPTVLHLHGARPVTAELRAQVEPLVARRTRREPLAYVLGNQSFMGLSLVCDARALVPRWDTETLVDRALADLRGLPSPVVADVGTGSGAIAVALAHLLPQATVWALDSSQAALSLAAENAELMAVSDRLRLARGHLLQPLPPHLRLDGLLANLPYIASDELDRLQPEVRDWEPREALDGGPDGLSLLRELAAEAPAHLRRGGWVLLEHGDTQGPAVSEMLDKAGYRDIELLRDLGDRPRATRGVWAP